MHSVTSGAVYDYVFSGNRDNKITNYNNALNNGFYYVNGDTVNCPPASLGFLGYNGDGALFVQRYSDDWICQICQDFRGNGGLYVRSKNEGTWGTWSRVSSTNWERLITFSADNYFEGKINGNDKILRGHFNGYAITTLTFGAGIGTLPSSYKPNTRMCALIDADIGTSGRVPCIVLINTDMVVRLYPIIQNQYIGSISNINLYGDVIFYLV